MKNHLILITLMAVAVVFGGCARSYPPAPIGDELVWTSDDERPGWTVDMPEPDDGKSLVFVGQSLYHSTERSARTNAEVDASSKAATYLAHQLNRNYNQITSGSALEDETQNNSVEIYETVELTADQVLAKMETEDTYIEMWRRGTGTFWKIYVKTRLPKSRI